MKTLRQILTEKQISETAELPIASGRHRFICIEEAMISYDSLPEKSRRVYDMIARTAGETAAIRAIYKKYFPNYKVA